MELTKEQIKYIDNRLENEGVKFWDIRIEMLDHIVCDVESKLYNQNDFKWLVQNSFEELGWKGSFENLIIRKRKISAKFFRGKISSEFKKIFISFLSLSIYASILIFCYYFSNEIMFGKAVLLFSLILFCIVTVFSFFKFKKVFYSSSILDSFIFLGTLLSLMNCALLIPKEFLDIENLSPQYLSIIVAVLFPLFFVGYKIFIIDYSKTNRIYSKLIKE
jgi:magnesium-transporting ATPase (P-type)